MHCKTLHSHSRVSLSKYNNQEIARDTFKVVIFIYLYMFIYYTFNTGTIRNHKIETKSGRNIGKNI